jgi:hypothetical protein
MYYRLSADDERKFLNLPETGMGYQIAEAYRRGGYSKEKFLILNSEIVIEINRDQSQSVENVISEGILSIKINASIINPNGIKILNELEFSGSVNESSNGKERGAIENPVENANGKEVFVRLSAFDNDLRIDKIYNCLRPGSYTTTMEDYMKCKVKPDAPIERYSLPNNDRIKFAFHIIPIIIDTLQRGMVQPANGKSGGGIEAYFAKGTAIGTYKKQTPY